MNSNITPSTEHGIRNPFRNGDMRRIFDGYVDAFHKGALRNPDGSQSRGGSHRVSFWNGYNGLKDNYTPKGSIGWACYRAGQACSKAESN